MRKILIALMLSLAVTQISSAADDLLKADHPDRYTVKKGDTLWDISSMFLEDAWRWPEIWQVNPDIDNPHLIYPGDVISLRWVDGKPQLSVDRGDEGRTMRLNPDVSLAPSVRIEPLTSAIPAIQLDAIAGLLSGNRVVGEDELEMAPYILAGKSERLVFGPEDIFYARGNWTSDTSVYGIFRSGQLYIDPETKEVLGREAIETGVGAVMERADDVYTMRLKTVEQEVRIGDRLLPTELRRLDSTFYPKAPEASVTGAIIATLDGSTLIGTNQAVAINRGEVQGVDVGDVLAIYRRGELVKDRVGGGEVRLPDERVGLLMVFRQFAKMSYGLVLETEAPVRVGDILRNP